MSKQSFVNLDLSIDETDITGGAIEILKVIRPAWKPTDIKFKFFDGGISNKVIGCYIGEQFEGDVVLVRIYGAGTNNFVDRKAELRYIKYLSEQGMCAPLYATFNNGRAYAYCSGVTLDNERFKTYRHQIIKEMVRLHSLKPNFIDDPPVSVWFDKLEKWLQMVPVYYEDPALQERFLKEIPPLSKLKEECELLKQVVDNMETRIVLCHNDLLWTNIIYDEKSDKVTFIDHEFMMFNYQPFEIGDHFTEYVGTEDMDVSRYPDKEYQLEWIRIYLEEWNKHNKITSPVTEDDVYQLFSQVNKFALLANFSWSIWAFTMARDPDQDFDYVGQVILNRGVMVMVFNDTFSNISVLGGDILNRLATFHLELQI